ncbi:hypothetical protein COLO4_05060 [Corchorus olitorius]|uniref:Uncharacterized protein n=1 Tax=Corchorus olitorius TaxID=93759 RepID=A0A1R3KS46_9ROSI|nr:hypothetical protein COLO4_05060 [Corchorus olitorius]
MASAPKTKAKQLAAARLDAYLSHHAPYSYKGRWKEQRVNGPWVLALRSFRARTLLFGLPFIYVDSTERCLRSSE